MDFILIAINLVYCVFSIHSLYVQLQKKENSTNNIWQIPAVLPSYMIFDKKKFFNLIRCAFVAIRCDTNCVMELRKLSKNGRTSFCSPRSLKSIQRMCRMCWEKY